MTRGARILIALLVLLLALGAAGPSATATSLFVGQDGAEDEVEACHETPTEAGSARAPRLDVLVARPSRSGVAPLPAATPARRAALALRSALPALDPPRRL